MVDDQTLDAAPATPESVMNERLWGLPFLLLGLYYGLMPRDRLRRHADRSARQAGAMFPWMNERLIRAEARTQYVLLRLVPPCSSCLEHS